MGVAVPAILRAPRRAVNPAARRMRPVDHVPDDVPSPIRFIEPAHARVNAAAAVPSATRAAAGRVLARDGRDLVLQPWQAAWLIATAEGREAFVPPGCGVGAGWLRARLDEELTAED
jgi:hypothetical protein